MAETARKIKPLHPGEVHDVHRLHAITSGPHIRGAARRGGRSHKGHTSDAIFPAPSRPAGRKGRPDAISASGTPGRRTRTLRSSASQGREPFDSRVTDPRARWTAKRESVVPRRGSMCMIRNITETYFCRKGQDTLSNPSMPRCPPSCARWCSNWGSCRNSSADQLAGRVQHSAWSGLPPSMHGGLVGVSAPASPAIAVCVATAWTTRSSSRPPRPRPSKPS